VRSETPKRITCAAILLGTAACGGGGSSAPPTTNQDATSSSSLGTTSTDAAPPTSTEAEESALFEGRTFSFEYPGEWEELTAAGSDARALETVFVGPGNRVDGVAMQVFRARPIKTEAEKRSYVAQLRREAKRNADVILERPRAIQSPGPFTAFFIAVGARTVTGDKIVRQQLHVYLRDRFYRFECQFAAARADQVVKDCLVAVNTLKIEGIPVLRG
jgi:hypothetical protein